MKTPTINASIKRLKNRYRLIIINDDTVEEVANFRLSRVSVYILLSTILLILITATIALLWYTPLKQYTPGYNQGMGLQRNYLQLKLQSDSILKVTQIQKQYIEGLHKTLLEQAPTTTLDTALLHISYDTAVAK